MIATSSTILRPIVYITSVVQRDPYNIFVRDELHDAEGRLQSFLNSVAATFPATHQRNGSDATVQPSRERPTSMDTVCEEDEEFDVLTTASRPSFRLGLSPDSVNSIRPGPPVYSQSIRSESPFETQAQDKPFPPRPSLKSGDDTASGADRPIIDEIAFALREWHTLMFQYLARHNYKLFHVVREHY